MPDALGWRKKFAVIAPSTNTIVQPDFDDMRPRGVTNHFSRVWIPDDPVESDADFLKLMENIRAGINDAVDRVMTCAPDYLVVGMSSETFWGGLQTSIELRERLEQRSGLGIAMGSDAVEAALRCYGAIKRIGVVTPYWPAGDAMVRKYFEESGLEVVHLTGLRAKSPMLISHITEGELRDALAEVDGPDVDAIVQAGTNVSMARLAGEAERSMRKPVIAINTAIYWYALRANGIDDVVEGFGSLLADFRELPAPAGA